MKFTIGIDVGGTCVDVVLLLHAESGGIKVVRKTKVLIGKNITASIVQGINSVLNHEYATRAGATAKKIENIHLGTTHMLNALKQHHVASIALIRLAASSETPTSSNTSLPPLCSWKNPALKEKVLRYTAILHGGFNYDKTLISPMYKDELIRTAQEIASLELDNIVISCVYAQLNPHQELLAAEVIKEVLPRANIFFSHEHTGSLLERESAAAIAAALKPTLTNVIEDLEDELDKKNLSHTKILMSENDGTVTPINEINATSALRAATRNSMSGAIKLHPMPGIGVIVDIGGTTADGAIVKDGQLPEQNTEVIEEGVCLTIPSIRAHSICLGGGTCIDPETFTLINKSVAKELTTQAICFGGEKLTVLDVALANGRGSIEKPVPKVENMRAKYNSQQLDQLDTLIHETLADFIIEISCKTIDKATFAILVGGGSELFDLKKLEHILSDKKSPISSVSMPENHAEVANAIGAAEASLAAWHTQIFELEGKRVEDAFQQVFDIVKQKLIAKGGDPKKIQIKVRTAKQIPYVKKEPTEIYIKCIAPRQSESSLVAADEYHIQKTPIASTAKKLLMIDTSPKQRYQEIPITSNRTKAAKQIAEILSKTTSLTLEQIRRRSIGFSFLGAGGGGSTRLSENMVKTQLLQGKKIKEIALDTLPDDANVFCFALMGSPDVFEENPPSMDDMIRSMCQLEDRIDCGFDAVIPLEGGGTNGLIAYVLAAELDIPVVCADTMGRAFPCLNMVTPVIYEKPIRQITSLASASGHQIIEAVDASALEAKTREATKSLGGAAMLSIMPMSGSIAKECCIPDTPKIAEAIGETVEHAHQQCQAPLISINEKLELLESEYRPVKQIAEGRIIDIRKTEEGGFNIGGIVIEGPEGLFEIIYQNENIVVRKKNKQGPAKVIEHVPHLIVIVDAETYEPFGTQLYDHLSGQSIRVLTMQAPKLLLDEKAMEIVGPESPTYKIKEICSILDGERTPADRASPAFASPALFASGRTGSRASSTPATPIQINPPQRANKHKSHEVLSASV